MAILNHEVQSRGQLSEVEIEIFILCVIESRLDDKADSQTGKLCQFG